MKLPKKLSTLTDNRYKIVLEESFQYELPEIRTPNKIWYEQIPCKGGAIIYLYSEKPLLLGMWTPRKKLAGTIWEAIKNTPGVDSDFHFDGEAIMRFPLSVLHIVADMAGARKKRRLSPEAKAALIERGAGHLQRYREQKNREKN